MNGGISAGQGLHFLAAHYIAGVPKRADQVLRMMLGREQKGKFQNGGARPAQSGSGLD